LSEEDCVTKWVIGYVVLCVVAIGAVLLVLLAGGGFDERGVGLYGKMALGLAVILVIIGGLALMVLSSARSRHDAARGDNPDARGSLHDRRNGPDRSPNP
jgi:hypothetical protein